MSRNPFVPPKPTAITLDTLPELFAHHRATFGGFSMTVTPPEPNPPAPPPAEPPALERPADIAEDEWATLGDPGKRAIVRERQRAEAAERALAASRQRPTPPKTQPPKLDDKTDPPKPPAKTDDIDIEAIVTRAVEAAVKPFAEREQQRDAEAAAGKVRDTVLDAAKPLLHDATDALAGIDLASIVDEQGKADAGKLKTALEGLIKRKPHLAKPTTNPRTAPPGIGGGGPVAATDAEKVKAVLADMQRATGARLPQNSNS